MKPLSVNQMKTQARGKIIKSAACKVFEFEFNHYLAEFSQQAILFVENFNEAEHSINVDYIFYLKRDEFFNQKDLLNKRCLDVDNAIKVVQDQVFRFLGVEDGLVTRITATKVPSDQTSVEILVKRVNLNRKVLNPQATAIIGEEIH
jgi:Holliday junction resolvase RusA-like endonuclease